MKITCLDGYYINDSWDYPNEDGVVLAIADDNQAIKDWEFFDCREHKKIKGEYAELLRNVVGFYDLIINTFARLLLCHCYTSMFSVDCIIPHFYNSVNLDFWAEKVEH